MGKTYFETARETYIEAWPAALCALSVAQQDVPLTREEAAALGACNGEYGELFRPGDDVLEALEGVRKRVADAVALFPKGAFVRLGSRSPKDAWGWRGENPGKILVGEDPLRYLLDSSERVSDDLRLALANDYAPHVWVRAWLDIPAWAEFRCLVRGKKLVGVTQYQPRAAFPEIAAESSVIRWAVDFFWRERFRPAIHLDDVVFDVFVKLRRRGNDCDAEVVLIEINPFGPYTDPILFDWRNQEDFDGSFRYRSETGMEKLAFS